MKGRLSLLVLLVASVACGLTVVGALDKEEEPTPDAGRPNPSLIEGGVVPEGGVDLDAADDAPPTPFDPFEAGVDASPSNCSAVCDAGTCDGGWCVMGCSGTSCAPNKVVCPPGVPCEVRCTGNDACLDGVDCAGATACKISCDGTRSCANSKVTCSGVACRVDCNKKDSCLAGVECDAGTCAIRCLEDDACGQNPVVCNAQRCSVQCGVSGDTGKAACIAGVNCRATQRCDVQCSAADTCKNVSPIAISGGTSDVVCSGTNSCGSTVYVAGADAGVRCGDGACKDGVSCDGGLCTASCKKTDSHLCCSNPAPTSCVTTQDMCVMGKSCP